jgi:hypothetical protein
MSAITIRDIVHVGLFVAACLGGIGAIVLVLSAIAGGFKD